MRARVKLFLRMRPQSFDRGKRLKGLDEFEQPVFVGRMSRLERRRELVWYAMLAGAVSSGVAMGLMFF